MSSDGVRPLELEPGSPERPSYLEWICMFIPIVGWMFGAQIQNRRESKLCAQISRQLNARWSFDSDAWARSVPDVPLDVVRRYCEAIRLVGDWPNAHFLPNDPTRFVIIWTEFAEIPHEVFKDAQASFDRFWQSATDFRELCESDLASLVRELYKFDESVDPGAQVH